jgi:hypothetical protein
VITHLRDLHVNSFTAFFTRFSDRTANPTQLEAVFRPLVQYCTVTVPARAHTQKLMMTTQITPESQTVQPTVPPKTERPQLDERLWRARIEENEKRDRMRLVRRVKVTAILFVLLALAALVRTLYG